MDNDFDKDGNYIEPPNPNRDLKLRVGEMVRKTKNHHMFGQITEIRWDMVIGVVPGGKPFTWLIGEVERIVLND